MTLEALIFIYIVLPRKHYTQILLNRKTLEMQRCTQDVKLLR